MSQLEENKALVRRFWDDLYAHELGWIGSDFSDDAVYDDVPVPAAKVVGPAWPSCASSRSASPPSPGTITGIDRSMQLSYRSMHEDHA
jgi:hypothetical protein